MNEVKKKLDYLKMSEKPRKSYDRYLMDLARENNIIETADQDGYLRGLKDAQEKIKKAQKEKEEAQKEKEKTLQKTKKAIIKFYKKGFSIKELAEDFDMSEDEVKEIIKEGK